MKHGIWFYVILLLILFHNSSYAQKEGYIQVKCEPDIQIFLDNDFKGISNKDVGGLIIQNVSIGKHTVKLIKTGFEPVNKEN
jgi:hypothetical protein